MPWLNLPGLISVWQHNQDSHTPVIQHLLLWNWKEDIYISFSFSKLVTFPIKRFNNKPEIGMRISDRHKQQGWAMLPAGLHQACELYQSNHTKTSWQDLLRLTKGLWQNSSQDSARKPKLRYDKKQNTCSKLQTVQRIEIKEGIIGLLSVWLKSNSNTSRCCTELFSAIWQKTWEFSICPA